MKMGAHFNEDDLFVHGFEYTVGTNDGAQFRKVKFTGTKFQNLLRFLIDSSNLRSSVKGFAKMIKQSYS